MLIELTLNEFYRSRYEAMRDWAAPAVGAAKETGDAALIAAAAVMPAFADAMTGPAQTARARRAHAAALVDELSDDELSLRPDAAGWLAIAEVYLDLYAEAEAHASRALGLARASGQGDPLHRLYPVLPRVWYVRGKLEKVTERLSAGAASMEQPGADLIAHYLDPDRLPVQDRWSRKHAHTQRRLCERFAAPVINVVTCQDITTGHTQQIVNAAPTAGEGDRVQGMISALVAAGIEGGYLTNPRLAKVHWQAGKRPLPAQRVTVAGESGLWVDPAEIPADDDIGKLGQALATRNPQARHGRCHARAMP